MFDHVLNAVKYLFNFWLNTACFNNHITFTMEKFTSFYSNTDSDTSSFFSWRPIFKEKGKGLKTLDWPWPSASALRHWVSCGRLSSQHLDARSLSSGYFIILKYFILCIRNSYFQLQMCACCYINLISMLSSLLLWIDSEVYEWN